MNLYAEVNKEESKFSLETRNVFLSIVKKEAGAHWPRLTKESGKLNYVMIDWAHYVDEDEEDEQAKGPNRENMQGNII